MWSSIEQIIKPNSLNEASVLLKEKGSVIFAGGTYLVAQKDRAVHTLLDINHLINDKIELRGREIHIGAGCTLQQIVNFDNQPLKNTVLSACPSKNIRNQRTLGGEIAQSRTDSDILIFLFTAGAQLLLSGHEAPLELSAWEGDGIIEAIIIPQHNVKLERVALLDSALAFVIVGINEHNDHITVSVGGKTSKILFFQANSDFVDAKLQEFMDEVEASFSNDHLGSPVYKRHVVEKLLQEMAVGK